MYISFNTLWDEESEMFLQILLSIQNGSSIGLKYGFIRIFLTFLGNTTIWTLKSTISNNIIYPIMILAAKYNVIKEHKEIV